MPILIAVKFYCYIHCGMSERAKETALGMLGVQQK